MHNSGLHSALLRLPACVVVQGPILDRSEQRHDRLLGIGVCAPHVMLLYSFGQTLVHPFKISSVQSQLIATIGPDEQTQAAQNH